MFKRSIESCMSTLVLVFVLPLGGCNRAPSIEPSVPRQSELDAPRAPDGHSEVPPTSAEQTPGNADAEPRPQVSPRTPALSADDPYYARMEGTSLANACKTDGECKVAGCSGEVCSADADAMTACEALPVQLAEGTRCGCVEGECLWYGVAVGAELRPPAAERPKANEGAAPPRSGLTCGEKTCEPDQTCVEYYGIAGPRGPKFQSCEWTCKTDAMCPSGMRCATIADGPGRVCR
jgi:eight-cysteine-cluster-containing protein